MLDKILYGITGFYCVGIIYKMCYVDIKLYRKKLGIPKAKQDISDMCIALEHLKRNKR